uniref:Uncharacterized protein n=1 Tax=Romanomermis culicivorax TaxID=13658 RepID=A0A915KIP3_ROMCU
MISLINKKSYIALENATFENILYKALGTEDDEQFFTLNNSSTNRIFSQLYNDLLYKSPEARPTMKLSITIIIIP